MSGTQTTLTERSFQKLSSIKQYLRIPSKSPNIDPHSTECLQDGSTNMLSVQQPSIWSELVYGFYTLDIHDEEAIDATESSEAAEQVPQCQPEEEILDVVEIETPEPRLSWADECNEAFEQEDAADESASSCGSMDVTYDVESEKYDAINDCNHEVSHMDKPHLHFEIPTNRLQAIQDYVDTDTDTDSDNMSSTSSGSISEDTLGYEKAALDFICEYIHLPKSTTSWKVYLNCLQHQKVMQAIASVFYAVGHRRIEDPTFILWSPEQQEYHAAFLRAYQAIDWVFVEAFREADDEQPADFSYMEEPIPTDIGISPDITVTQDDAHICEFTSTILSADVGATRCKLSGLRRCASVMVEE
jgi:hypothetical protein